MATKRETALAAVAALLEGVGGAASVRNPEAVQEAGAGLFVVRDGEPGEPEILLSPRLYIFQHPVPIEVYVEGGNSKEAALDALLSLAGPVLEADPTLGGLIDHLVLSAPVTAFDRPPGAEDFAAARFFATLEYTTTSPLG